MAFIDGDFAVTIQTTLISIDEAGAGLGLFARAGSALVDVYFAIASGLTWFADTSIA